MGPTDLVLASKLVPNREPEREAGSWSSVWHSKGERAGAVSGRDWDRTGAEHQERVSHRHASRGGEMEAGIPSWRDSL